MKKLMTILLGVLFLGSCKDKGLEPVTGKNSKIILEDIYFQDLINGQELIGRAYFDFFVPSEDGSKVDTINWVDTFNISNPYGYTQTYDFNTPSRTQAFNFRVRFQIKGGQAKSMSVKKFYFKSQDKIHYDGKLEVNGADSSFSTPPLSFTF